MADRAVGLPALPGAGPQAPVVRLDQPALLVAGGPPAPAPMWDAAARQAVVEFRDGTWRLCRVTSWRRQSAGGWACGLRWGISGRLYQADYVYDPARVRRALASRAGDG